MNDAGRREAYTLLVVDDDDCIRGCYATWLRGEGFYVIEATNGLEAVDAVRQFRPDLVLMDLSMPVMDGLTATLRIRESAAGRDAIVLAHSAHPSAQYRSAALAAGFDGYVAKPADLDDLSGLIASMLGLTCAAA